MWTLLWNALRRVEIFVNKLMVFTGKEINRIHWHSEEDVRFSLSQ